MSALPRPACFLIVCAALAGVAAGCGSNGGYTTSGRNAPTAPTGTSAVTTSTDASSHTAPAPAPTPPAATLGDAFGTVSNLSGSCPSIVFTAGKKTIDTNASTRFDRGACSDVANGIDIAARGSVQPDGSILAVAMTVRVAPAANQPTEVLTFGTIAGLAGTCPSLMFSLGTQAVSTNASTTFNGVACASLTNSERVEVAGTTQPDGSILAARIDSNRNRPRP